MLIPDKVNIVGTILARNEEDILAVTLEHHIECGISKFIVTDNNSTDKTREIFSKYSEVAEIIDEPEDTHFQSKWVSKMAQLACKLKPDWIVHLDADELWGGLLALRKANAKVVSCERMYLHPPTGAISGFSLEAMQFYLNFDHLNLPQECKVAHRPDPNIVIAHGNHSVINAIAQPLPDLYRHHYPVRSYTQWERKATQGHLALAKREAICERWNNWYNLHQSNQLLSHYQSMTECWLRYIQNNLHSDFMSIIKLWSTPEMIEFFNQNPNLLPSIGKWKPSVIK